MRSQGPVQVVAVDGTVSADSAADGYHFTLPQRRPGAAASSRPRGSLAGRDRELAALQGELTRAAQGELRVVLVAGDPGIGKTRLVRAVMDAAPAGTISLEARGYPLGATMAYGLWVEALEPLLDAM